MACEGSLQRTPHIPAHRLLELRRARLEAGVLPCGPDAHAVDPCALLRCWEWLQGAHESPRTQQRCLADSSRDRK